MSASGRYAGIVSAGCTVVRRKADRFAALTLRLSVKAARIEFGALIQKMLRHQLAICRRTVVQSWSNNAALAPPSH